MGGACSEYGMRRDDLGDSSVDGRINIRIFKNWDVKAWTGSSRLRIGTGSGHL